MSALRAIVTSLDAVEPRPISWLWRHRLARGKLNFLVGDPGLGKSFITVDLAARVSTGSAWPDSPNEEREPGGVLLFNAEDAAEDTIVPRLIAAQADRSRIKTIAVECVDDEDGSYVQHFNIGRHLPVLEQHLREQPDTALVVLDPISAYCGSADTHKNSEVRGLLAPLAEVATRHDVAILCVSHLNKSAGTGNALYRTMGSLAFTAAARMVWAVAKCKNDDTRRLMLPVKHNIAPQVTGLAFRVAPADDDSDMAVVAWEPGEVTTSADDALGGSTKKPATKTEAAVEWLRDLLRDGPIQSDNILRMATDAGFKDRTVWEAKRAAGVKARKQGFEGPWEWYV